MDRYTSMNAVKQAIGGEFFSGKVDAIVSQNGCNYFYSHIYMKVSYNIGYMQIDVELIWEDDLQQPDYHEMGLHGKYSTKYQTFRYDKGNLMWEDGPNSITVML